MSAELPVASLGAIAASVIALMVVSGAKRSIAHWCFFLGMFGLACESLCTGLAADSVLPDYVLSWLRPATIVQAMLPLPWLAFSFTYARGNAREQLVRSRWLLLGSFLIPVGLAVVSKGNLIREVAWHPDTGVWFVQWGGSGKIFNALFLVLLVFVIMNLERTFRASVGTMRWRIKFMILGLGILFAVRAYTSTQALLFPVTSLGLTMINNGALLLACLLVLRSVFRTGNFEVSVYPSQSVLANSFTVIVAGIYLLIVGLLANLVTHFGGEAAFALKTFVVLVAIVLLTVALLSDRVRLTTRQFVSRHFQRPVHDYRTVWQKITQSTATCLDPGELCSVMARIISEVFQCLSVTIWLIDERKEKLLLSASTSLLQFDASKAALTSDATREIITALDGRLEPVDIDACSEPWAAALRRLHPSDFKTGGHRLCIPMAASGELLGFIQMGDRVSGMKFAMQDLDLLKAVAGHAAASLKNSQLSNKLTQARQLEAFQAMSAFFVHDLKNTASTLSLMLQNFPVHYQDPAFRNDALRGISRTVTHINELIGRLNMLRHELRIQAVECNLNEVVAECVRDQEHSSGIEMVKVFRDSLPKVRIDPVHIQKVITNLLLNSREAISGPGRIQIETGRENGWVIIAVSDNGCGMSPEFIQSSLFRPFQTTKKRGIGIGMFHCKMIVEAHRGRIEVSSEPGVGSSFRVLLPIAPELVDANKNSP